MAFLLIESPTFVFFTYKEERGQIKILKSCFRFVKKGIVNEVNEWKICFFVNLKNNEECFFCHFVIK
ncbi:hypothetical protein B0A78_13450 [Flavobacterium columnare NBRC 100251 = ATCC 23463]|uniref:Uncharacterized protein n=1 Tax=Flavobacterium columnare (strain ATCC 49512 / CIP 103533 / TG 44/87) TaxID=1041826 RepID=G8X624_FLACA|nr:hypothetical protein FCOL_07175 [Flavobacterium columnare ATCC 49512]APT23407.1 hypothetical protein BU993_12710 [Flavobacterium columnare]PDS21883.1 hypothetical protein B0A78_13450 [Flavobacterium columnare NBRC 100251 = ATCC 23463]MBF6652812.1 hypothetical protein [Flavobacterium columnare]MBF6655761.1 hypothetical protein [Flavobacterium columnare]